MEILNKKAVELLIENNLTIVTAESCTGGWLSKIITEISGASEIFMGGVCSYSNDIKMNVLGVKEDTLKAFGAVSEETAREMSQGILKLMKTSVGVGITGIAGPNSDGTDKPVGLGYIAVGMKDGVHTYRYNFSGSREEIMETAKNTALFLAIKKLKSI